MGSTSNRTGVEGCSNRKEVCYNRGSQTYEKKIVILFFALASGAYGQVPKGWRVPMADIKGQWSEKHWEKECQKLKDRWKKSTNDAVEYTGDSTIDKAKDVSSKPEEAEECWTPEKFPVHTATGDYNGNGFLDKARILLSITKPLKIGFFVFLRTKTAHARAILLHSYEMVSALSPPQDHFIETQPPIEKMETWCNKMEECKPYEPKFITIKRDSVIFGEFEVWGVVAYWSAAENKFKLETLSD